MPRFFKKAKVAPKGRYRRRLGVGVSAATALAPYAPYVAEGAVALYKNKAAGKKSLAKAKYNKKQRVRSENLMLSDNIATMPLTVIGKQKPLSFDERVSRVDRPPILFKRNYEFTAECSSGRKAWFALEFNIMNSTDLANDVTTFKAQQYTDTATQDPTAPLNTAFDGAKFYVDYLNEKLSFMNSSSSSLSGKIHLFAHRKDCNTYAGAPVNPINMMMYYSTNRLPLQQTSQESILGYGWKFDTSTASLNYQAVYTMPGSAMNATGVCAFTDPALSPSSPHISDSMGYWFRKVNSFDFNLKPGQQINKSYTFNDLPNIFREEQVAYTFLSGITYSCIVEFTGQVAGDNLNSNVSSSFTQLSVTRQSTRKMGIRNKIKSKIYLVTNPQVILLPAATVIINPDLGQSDVGVDYDFN